MTARKVRPGGHAPKGQARKGPVTEDEKALILALLSEGMGRNDIAAEVGRAVGTVSKVVAAAGQSFTGVPMQAVQRRKEDLAERRAELADAIDSRLRLVAGQMGMPNKTVQWDARNGAWVEYEAPLPPARAMSDYGRALQSLMLAQKVLQDMDREAEKGAGGDIDTVAAFITAQIDGQAEVA